MPIKVNAEEFHTLSEKIPVIDVRSPKEFETGHYPGAYNIPIFNNEERAVVGTIYKRISRNDSVLKGLELVGPKLKEFAQQAQSLAKDNQLLIYCWRGGMRSASMAWLFETVGIKTYILVGGYKAFRRAGKKMLSKTDKLIVVGGLTGSGKTETLKEIKNQGEQVCDLEGIAHHKGSAFGALGQEKQPTNEQFENNLIYEWFSFNLDKPIWVEDESHSIGNNWIPDELFSIMRKAPVIKMEIDKKIRIKRLVDEYAGFDKKYLENCIFKISKRLGGQHAKKALESLEKGFLEDVADITLTYYDKSYSFGLSKRDNNTVFPVQLNSRDCIKNAGLLIEFQNNFILNKKTEVNSFGFIYFYFLTFLPSYPHFRYIAPQVKPAPNVARIILSPLFS